MHARGKRGKTSDLDVMADRAVQIDMHVVAESNICGQDTARTYNTTRTQRYKTRCFNSRVDQDCRAESNLRTSRRGTPPQGSVANGHDKRIADGTNDILYELDSDTVDGPTEIRNIIDEQHDLNSLAPCLICKPSKLATEPTSPENVKTMETWVSPEEWIAVHCARPPVSEDGG